MNPRLARVWRGLHRPACDEFPTTSGRVESSFSHACTLTQIPSGDMPKYLYEISRDSSVAAAPAEVATAFTDNNLSSPRSFPYAETGDCRESDYSRGTGFASNFKSESWVCASLKNLGFETFCWGSFDKVLSDRVLTVKSEKPTRDVR